MLVFYTCAVIGRTLGCPASELRDRHSVSRPVRCLKKEVAALHASDYWTDPRPYRHHPWALCLGCIFLDRHELADQLQCGQLIEPVRLCRGRFSVQVYRTRHASVPALHPQYRRVGHFAHCAVAVDLVHPRRHSASRLSARCLAL